MIKVRGGGLVGLVLAGACSTANPATKPDMPVDGGTAPDAGATLCVQCAAIPDWANGCDAELTDCVADSKCSTWYKCALDHDLFPTPVATYNMLNAQCLRTAGLLSQSDPSFKPYMLFGTCAAYRCDCQTDYNPTTGNPGANAPDNPSGSCAYDASSGCGACACAQCPSEITTCMNDPLCAAVLNCMADTQCTTFEDCFSASKCLTQGLAVGGGGAPSYARLVKAMTCSKSKCDSCVTAPKDSRNTAGLQSVMDGG
jgi:hypothetical protein